MQITYTSEYSNELNTFEKEEILDSMFSSNFCVYMFVYTHVKVCMCVHMCMEVRGQCIVSSAITLHLIL